MFNRRYNTTTFNDASKKLFATELFGEGTASPRSVTILIGKQEALGEGVTSLYNVVKMINAAFNLGEGTLAGADVVRRQSPKLLTIMAEGTLVALWSLVEHGPFTNWHIKKFGTDKEI